MEEALPKKLRGRSQFLLDLYRRYPSLYRPSIWVPHLLQRGGFTTVEQVEQATDDQLLAVRNLGQGSLRKIRAVIPNPERWKDPSQWVAIATEDFTRALSEAIVALASARDAAYRTGNQQHRERLAAIINELEIMDKFP